MYLLNIIDDIYSNKYFTTILIISIIVLIILFVIVLILGIRDSKKLEKQQEPKKEEEVKDITFEPIPEHEKIKEDVTFEMPSLSKNLEDFKKNLEEELLQESKRPFKVVDVNELEDTIVQPVIDEEQIEKNMIKPKEIKTLEEIVDDIEKTPVKETDENTTELNKVIEKEEITKKESIENVIKTTSLNNEIPIIKENFILPQKKEETPIIVKTDTENEERKMAQKREELKRLNDQLFSSVSLNKESENKPVVVKTDEEEIELPELK